MDIMNFIGRLHPLVVHLPIGFLFLALLVEWFIGKGKSNSSTRIVLFILILGALSSVVAIVCGWLLAMDGDYETSLLSWHRWLGTAIGILAIIAPIAKYFSKKQLYRVTLISIGLLLVGTGHYGGSLTHGSDYLIQPLKGTVSENNFDLFEIRNPDSIIVYTSFIQPMLERKCYDCHNSEKDMGGLNMDSYAKLLEGGDHGKVVTNDPWSSELILRVTLPKTNEKYMPPKGAPLNYNEISLLKWWIEQGSDSLKTITEMEPNKTVKHILASNYKIDTSPKTFVERVQAPSVNASILDSLTHLGWEINQIAEGNNFLEVSPKNKNLLSKKDLSVLAKIKDNITWLDLSGLALEDADIGIISKFKNLTKLQLGDNGITENGLVSLSSLKHLESLNLANNPIQSENLDWAKPLTSLKRVYLWQTKTNPDSVDRIRESFPEIQVIL
ncbi:c-type cytochrome domain-containing protein [Aestuariivivens insulae]|uniref:c-type cytochrome domain-containing protein n=1 Tax=Aestuariivivens insulae TaxID=1621988 RepID=UPI001F59FD3A|nr:c-type cytochrome domain-containing protein [Aestuariivivens insulae]